jgi:hypothetical protein
MPRNIEFFYSCNRLKVAISYPAVNSWYAQDVRALAVLPPAQTMSITFLVSSGTPDNDVCDIFVNGYTFSNGS